MKNSTACITLTILLSTVACGPPDVPADCVPVDEQLGEPIHRQWCDGELNPTIQWNEGLADSTQMVCLLPDETGECDRCPTNEIRQSVEQQLIEDLAEYEPECTLEHWELGCMRTVENAKKLGRDPEYCCFQVAIWGDSCGSNGGAD